EDRHPPRVPRHDGHLHLRRRVPDAQHRAVRLAARRRVQRLPPVLHGQAEDPRHRRPHRALPAALRQEGL
ncbi:MAG: LSU ribosomal protein L31p @ LSU ribosomal protein L31p, zinc-dependent, partial [uncultured Quadrisphaera sp.]